MIIQKIFININIFIIMKEIYEGFMKEVIASDSFKGSLTSIEIRNICKEVELK